MFESITDYSMYNKIMHNRIENHLHEQQISNYIDIYTLRKQQYKYKVMTSNKA